MNFYSKLYMLKSFMDDLDTLKMQSIILDYMSDSIFVHDLNGKFVYVNKEAYESRGYTKEELLAMHVKDLDAPMDEESIKKMKNNIAKMKEQGFVTFEIEHKRKDDSIIPVEIRSQIFELHGDKLVISVARDISDRYEVQKALRTLATTDPLTGIYNRHKFEILYDTHIEKQKLDNSTISLLLIDIDHFKRINDNCGHNIGDTILIEFCMLISSAIRTTDIFARWGGEEFIILLPNTNSQNAMMIANKLKNLVSSHNFSHINKVTVSIGISIYEQNDALESFIKKADTSLYKAKNLGRNRVELFNTQI